METGNYQENAACDATEQGYTAQTMKGINSAGQAAPSLSQSGLAGMIRQKLYARRDDLRRELNQVQAAIRLTETDEAVNKVLEVLAAAKI